MTNLKDYQKTNADLWESIKTRLLWLTANKDTRDLEMSKTDGKAAEYANYQIKTLGEMRRYSDQQELANLLSDLDFDDGLKEIFLPAVRLED